MFTSIAFPSPEIDEAAHLLFEAVYVVLNGFWCHHLSHIGTTGWITDHGRTTADQRNRLVSCHLQTFHQTQCHKMSHMQTVSCRVKTDIKYRFSIVDEFLDFFLVGYLCDQTAGNQFVVKSVIGFPPVI